ncbi:MAG: hypothetical protein RR244_03590 [Oscillospiraceae bacterium]
MTDIVKLIYQNEFAGGHAIADAQDSARWLSEEWEIVTEDETCELKEDIGNGLVRLHLAAAKAQNIPQDAINDAFVATSNTNAGNVVSFESKLVFAQNLCECKMLFAAADFRRFLADYRKQNLPAIHHSEVFRNSYFPHYRVISSRYFK